MPLGVASRVREIMIVAFQSFCTCSLTEGPTAATKAYMRTLDDPTIMYARLNALKRLLHTMYIITLSQFLTSSAPQIGY